MQHITWMFKNIHCSLPHGRSVLPCSIDLGFGQRAREAVVSLLSRSFLHNCLFGLDLLALLLGLRDGHVLQRGCPLQPRSPDEKTHGAEARTHCQTAASSAWCNTEMNVCCKPLGFGGCLLLSKPAQYSVSTSSFSGEEPMMMILNQISKGISLGGGSLGISWPLGENVA